MTSAPARERSAPSRRRAPSSSPTLDRGAGRRPVRRDLPAPAGELPTSRVGRAQPRLRRAGPAARRSGDWPLVAVLRDGRARPSSTTTSGNGSARCPGGPWPESPPDRGDGAAAARRDARRAHRRAGRWRRARAARSTTTTAAFLGLVADQIATALVNGGARAPRRSAAGRRAGRARPGQDRVLLQHQPRVPHPADADARAGRGAARRRRTPRRPGAARADWTRAPQRPAPAASWSTPCSTSPGSRPAGSRPATSRPTCAPLTAELASGFRSAFEQGRPALRGRLPAARRAGLRRPRACGRRSSSTCCRNAFKFTFEGRIRRAAAAARRDAVELTVDGHRHRHRRPTSCRGCSSASTASRAPAARTHEGTGIGLALVQRAGPAARRRRSRAEHAGRGHDLHRRACRSGARTCRPDAVGAERPRRRRRRRRPSRSSRRRCAGCPVGRRARRRAGRGPPEPARGSWWPTTTPTCASTSPAAAPALRRSTRSATAARPWHAARTRTPGPDPQRRDDAAARRLGLVRRAARPTRAPAAIPVHAPVGARRRGGAVEGLAARAPTTTSSSRSPPRNCWPGSGATSSWPGCATTTPTGGPH